MSIKIMSQVWENGPEDRGELLVLLALADFADDRGRCWPAVTTLAKRARMTPRSVQRIIRKMEGDGKLSVSIGTGRSGCNEYVLAPAATATPDTMSPLTPVSPPPDARVTPPLTPVSPEPSLNHHEPSRDTNVSLRREKPDLKSFDEFWDTVPRKAGKGAARKAYAQAVKKSDAQTIIAGMQRYAEERAGKDEKYTAHPATWLNAERWTDAPAKAGAADFHDQLTQALGGDNGLPAKIANHHGETEHVPARIPATGAPDNGTGPARDTPFSGRGEQAYRRLNRS